MSKLCFKQQQFVLDGRIISVDLFAKDVASKPLQQVQKLYGLTRYLSRRILRHYQLPRYGGCLNGTTRTKFQSTGFYYDALYIEVAQLVQYYIVENHSKQQTAQHFSISMAILSKAIKQYAITKPKEKTRQLAIATNLSRYGVGNYNNIEQVQRTVRARYGVKNVFQAQAIKQKAKQTLKKKFGVASPMHSAEIKQRVCATTLQRYGKPYFSQTAQFTQKTKQTNLKNYGVQHPMRSQAYRANFDFCAIAKKAFQTKRINGTVNMSGPQLRFLQFLSDKLPCLTVYTQYADKDRYPYHCDFYIQDFDLFIQFNLFFTHGGQPFDSTNQMHIAKANDWLSRAQSSKFYKNALKVWTGSDPQKFACAIKNGLNYIACYTIKDIQNLKEKLLNDYYSKLANLDFT